MNLSMLFRTFTLLLYEFLYHLLMTCKDVWQDLWNEVGFLLVTVLQFEVVKDAIISKIDYHLKNAP